MLVYIATSPSNRKYVGVTNNFKRRLKEHGSSPYPFGNAIRKYGKEAFTFEFIECDSLEEALRIESEMIGVAEVKSDEYYNISCGGRPDVHMGLLNPMKRPEVSQNHPKLFTSEYNPMNDPKIREGHNAHQKKPVMVAGVRYDGVRDAARETGNSRQKLVHRFKSKNYPDHYYL